MMNDDAIRVYSYHSSLDHGIVIGIAVVLMSDRIYSIRSILVLLHGDMVLIYEKNMMTSDDSLFPKRPRYHRRSISSCIA
jgi:hypothetical protein